MMQNNTISYSNKCTIKILEPTLQLTHFKTDRAKIIGDKIVANIRGEGVSTQEALNQARDRALKLKDGIEVKYGCKLSYPEFGPSPAHITISNIEKPANDKRMQLGIKKFDEVYFPEHSSGLILGKGKDLQRIISEQSGSIGNRKFPIIRVHIKSLILKKLIGIAANHIMNHLEIRMVNLDDIKNLKSDFHNKESAPGADKNN